MSEPEQCIICLDPLPRPSSSNGGDSEAPVDTAITANNDAVEADSSYLNILASLDGCDHIIHDACIRSWAQKTNTCPICRKPFHFVRVYNGLDDTAISTYEVKDKKQVAEFDVQQWLGENPDEEEEESNPCPICSSAEREDILLLCDSCDAAYHTHCIGLDYIPEGDWHCMECAHLFELTDEPELVATSDTEGELPSARPQTVRRPIPRSNRGFHVRTRARLRRARRQARNAEWQGAWGQFSGRFYEMSDLDLDNHDDEDEDLERFRRFQQLDRRELQRWQQRISIAQRLGAHETFANYIPPQISERLQPEPPPVETVDERRAWGAFERVRDTDASSPNTRKRKTRSITGSPAEPPAQEPERKLKRPRTRRLPHAEGSAAAPAPTTAGSSTGRAPNGSPSRPGPLGRDDNEPTLVVSSLLKELEPNAQSDDEALTINTGWRHPPEASSPALSPSPSAYSSPRALSLTPPPLPSANGRPTSPTLSLSTHIEPIYPPANYSPNRYGSGSEHSDSESRPTKTESRPLELRQPRPRRAHQVSPSQEDASSRWTMSQEEKKSINDIVKNALRPHWRAQKLTTEQYATINRDISRKLYDEVKDASLLNDKSRRTWEKRATQEVAQAVSELQA
ncbi:PHD and RING finger domain-containing protein [Cladobotryum mycophilum]|uniref:PHD and RING finger domain-containing protein n=1 Tax=Cladobotryum mycophilum TaxID=491253 RepID=A0ABR0SDF4_9HYPO